MPYRQISPVFAGLAAMSIAAPAPVFAESAAEPGRSREFDGIIVSAARSELPASALPLTIDVLDGEELRDQIVTSGSIVDAISARYPAFSPTREKLTGSGESLRGRSPLYAINGIPQSTPVRDGSRDGYTIDPFFIDRVEVIYGSNALQGIGATGGVVNQVTVGAPATDGWAGRALLQGTAADGFYGEALGGKAAGYVAYRALSTRRSAPPSSGAARFSTGAATASASTARRAKSRTATAGRCSAVSATG
jgi:iron complex outermembrane recepter protein